jgi:four helix bundle protein
MRDHKSLLAWIEARELTRAVIHACRDHWTAVGHQPLKQLQRAALSVQLNIAEGHALGDRGRFGNHLAMAYGSAVEASEILELLRDEKLLPADFCTAALERSHRCERLLLGLLKRYRKQPVR